MENKTTVEIHEELASREGVTEIIIAPYELFQIVQDQRTHEFTGPAKVIIEREINVVPEATINFNPQQAANFIKQHALGMKRSRGKVFI